MATVNPSTVRNVTGSVVDLTQASPDGDELNLAGTRRVFLLAHNASADAVTVTATTIGTTWNGHPIPDTTITVPPSSLVITPMEADRYEDDSGHCQLTYSATAGVRVAAATT